MQKNYEPEQTEQSCYQHWEKQGYFKPSTEAGKDSFCIMLPPPNVTGSLHMGHAFQLTLMDVLTRYHRMKGKNTLWQAGTDHAGIATQLVVDAKLKREGKDKNDLGREGFLEEVWKWKEQSGDRIIEQQKRMGASLDWSSERFTLDPTISKAVFQVFEQLYDEGLIYRGKRLVNWDPSLKTAVSDLEVESKEKQGSIWYIAYPIENSKEKIIVATTRPETFLGDVAVAVHPEDKRYQHLLGEMVRLPIVDRLIPIIADEYVDPEFGTGCVKITPAHDFNDYEMGQRHDLPFINILNPDATLNEHVPEAYQGLDRFKARDKVLSDLMDAGFIEKIEAHVNQTPYSARSGEVVEPYLTEQWFMKMKPLAEPALNTVKQGHLKFVPQNWENTYFHWLENIQDWCISRQLWWGHRIPAWYDDKGNLYVAETEEKARKKYNLSESIKLEQDTDVLDTWFSSALWPFATLGWPVENQMLKAFYSTDVLVTGFDIIFFWVARMIMMGLKFTGKVPFHTVYIHGLIRDEKGQKMSKSVGNVIDPIDLIDGIDLQGLIDKRTYGLRQPEKIEQIKENTKKAFPEGISAYGTDALRFTFAALASTSRDIQFSLKRIEGYRNFCNKIWNAARYVGMQIDQKGAEVLNYPSPSYTLIDLWIQDQLQQTIQKVEAAMNEYRFDHLAQAFYEFIWHEYCDWYLELSKVVLNNSDSSEAEIAGTCQTLVSVLSSILRMLHPIMPFITENIWQTAGFLSANLEDTIMLQPYPEFDAEKSHPEARFQVDTLKGLLLAVRNIRGEMNISPNQTLKLCLSSDTQENQHLIQPIESLFTQLGKISEMTWHQDKTTIPNFSATAVYGSLTLSILLEGLIDKEAEIKRLNKEIQKHEATVAQCEKKLNNPSYVEKAPEKVVLKEKEKLEAAEISLKTLHQQLESLGSM